MTGVRVEWIEPDGTVTNLDDPAAGLVLLGDVEGTGMPEPRFRSSAQFDQAGEVLESARFGPRTLSVPFALYSQAGTGPLRAGLRTLVRKMSPVRGTGALRISDPDNGIAREAYARYAGGLDGRATSPENDWGRDEWHAFVVQVKAFDPYWYDVAEHAQEFRTTGTTEFFPMFDDPTDVGPHFSSGAVFGEGLATNIGDGNAWPVWTILGPAVAIRLENLTTGAVLDLGETLDDASTATLAEGETLTIDTRPGAKTITGPAGENWRPYATDASDLWPIVVGPNRIQVTAGGATVASSVRLAYRCRYLSL